MPFKPKPLTNYTPSSRATGPPHGDRPNQTPDITSKINEKESLSSKDASSMVSNAASPDTQVPQKEFLSKHDKTQSLPSDKSKQGFNAKTISDNSSQKKDPTASSAHFPFFEKNPIASSKKNAVNPTIKEIDFIFKLYLRKSWFFKKNARSRDLKTLSSKLYNFNSTKNLKNLKDIFEMAWVYRTEHDSKDSQKVIDAFIKTFVPYLFSEENKLFGEYKEFIKGKIKEIQMLYYDPQSTSEFFFYHNLSKTFEDQTLAQSKSHKR